MAEYEFYTVNVFSEHGISGGNQLGVVLDPDRTLTVDQMQSIAQQFNYSESTFVNQISNEGAEVRIFLPHREIPFAGHPTIGTAYILEYLWRKQQSARKKLILNVPLGSVEVRFASDKKDVGLVSMDQFTPKIIGEFTNTKLIAEILGINKNEILDKSILKIAPSDLPFMFIPLINRDAVDKCKPNYKRLVDEFSRLGGEPYVFSWSRRNEVYARLFAPYSGVPEDPATGSAQAALCEYLVNQNFVDVEKAEELNILTYQGYKMGRPSSLYNKVTLVDKGIAQVETSGKNFLASHGTLFV